MTVWQQCVLFGMPPAVLLFLAIVLWDWFNDGRHR